jgi:hypothetical protein
MSPLNRGHDHARISENTEHCGDHSDRAGNLTMSRLDDTLAALATMTPAQLRDEWQRVHKTPPPRISPDLLARGIAWQLQERALGGLARSAAREIKRLAAASAADAHIANKGANDSGNNADNSAGPQRRSPTRASAPTFPPTNATDLRPDTTLMRSWGGRSWSVLVSACSQQHHMAGMISVCWLLAEASYQNMKRDFASIAILIHQTLPYHRQPAKQARPVRS